MWFAVQGLRYKSESKGVVIFPDDRASAADLAVIGQDEEELFSADATIDLSVRAELPAGFRDILESTLNRPGTVCGHSGTTDLVIEGNSLVGSLVSL